jgi:hypothetical protein
MTVLLVLNKDVLYGILWILMESILQQESDKVDTDGVPGITSNDKTIIDLLNPIYFWRKF